MRVFTPVYLFVVLPGPWIARDEDSRSCRLSPAASARPARGAHHRGVDPHRARRNPDVTQLVIALGALAALLAIRRYKPRRVTAMAESLVVAVAAVVGLVLT